MTTTSKPPAPVRHAGRMKFNQAVGAALSAFLKSPEGVGLNYDAFTPETNDLRDQSSILSKFARFLLEHA